MSSTDNRVGDRHSVPDNRVIKPPDEAQNAQPIASQITLNNISETVGSLKDRVSRFSGDVNWSRLALNIIIIVSLVLSLTYLGNSIVPAILGIVATPFFLKPALQATKERFNLMEESHGASNIKESGYWGARSLGIFSMALQNVVGLASGIAVIAGGMSLMGVGLAFNLIIPIAIASISGIGAIAETWATARTFQAYRKFKQLKEESDKSSEKHTRLQEESAKALKQYNQFKIGASEALKIHNQLKEKADKALQTHNRLHEKSYQRFEEVRLALRAIKDSNQKDQAAITVANEIIHSYGQLKSESEKALEAHNQLIREAAKALELNGQFARDTVKALETYNQLKVSDDHSLKNMESALQYILGPRTNEQVFEVIEEINNSLNLHLEQLESDKEKFEGSELKLIEETLARVKELKAFYKNQKDIEAIQKLDESQKKLIALKLEQYHSMEQHFSSGERRVSLRGRVRVLLKSPDLKKTAAKITNLFSTLKKEDFNSMTEKERSEIRTLIFEIRDLSTQKLSEFEGIEHVLHLYNQLEVLYISVEKDSKVKDWMKTSIDEIRNQREELEALKNTLLKEGTELLETGRSEMHRRIFTHSLFILFGILSVVSIVLKLFPSPYHVIAIALILAVCALDVLYIFSDLYISQDKFLAIDRFFHSRKKPPVVNVDEMHSLLRRREAMGRGQENLA